MASSGSPTTPPVDLTNCDQEPIHIPGAIQPHGVLLAVTPPDLRIVQLSANTADHGMASPPALLGRSLDHVLAPESASALRQALTTSDPRDASPLRLTTAAAHGARLFDGILHRSGELIVVELEPALDPEGLAFADFYPHVRGAFARLQRGARVTELCQLATDELATLTGFDRVMAYRFDRDGHGHVIAETRRPELEPFLDLHYPASDIPAQARRLYTLNWLRLIVDVAYAPTPLLASDPDTAPLDLSFAVLRSVSPIHVQYLKNMGLQASMSVSLVVDGQLWGLLICHHHSPRFVPYEVRAACEFLGQALSWQVAARERAETFEHRATSQRLLARLIDQLGGASGLATALTADVDAVLGLVEASGMAARVQGSWVRVGQTPEPAELEALAPSLAAHMREGLLATEKLGELAAEAQACSSIASGALAVALGSAPGDLLVWFRPEVVQTVRWAGDPHKLVTLSDGHARLSPRGSFALWRETVRARSRPWQPWQVEAASDLRRALVGRILRRNAELEELNARLSQLTTELAESRDALEAKVAELRRSEERYRTLFASIDDGFCLIELIVDDDGRVVDYRFLEANAAFEVQTGLRAPVGKTIVELAPGISTSWFEIYGRVVATGETTRFENHDPALHRWFDAYANRVGPAEQRQVTIVFKDITARKLAEQERENMLKELAQSNQELDQFAYVASHDLKAPLRGIANLSHWIEDDLAGAMTAEVRHKLGMMRGRVQRLEDLINALLRYASAGRSQRKPESTDVGSLIAETITLLSPPPHVAISVSEPMPTFPVERVPFQQVFMNLIGNALKYNSRPGATVRVEVADEGDSYHFTVADNGPGIAPEYHERIWGIFQKLESRDDVEGTGIGLSVVKKIVETRGGRTWVESREGAGATFHVLWPRQSSLDT